MVSLTLGMFGMIYLAVVWCVSRLPGHEAVHLHETAALYYALVALLIGTQLLAIGFVAEMIASLVSRDSDLYSVSQHTPPSSSGEIDSSESGQQDSLSEQQ